MEVLRDRTSGHAALRWEPHLIGYPAPGGLLGDGERVESLSQRSTVVGVSTDAGPTAALQPANGSGGEPSPSPSACNACPASWSSKANPCDRLLSDGRLNACQAL